MSRNTVGDHLGKRVNWATRTTTANEKMIRRLVDYALSESDAPVLSQAESAALVTSPNSVTVSKSSLLQHNNETSAKSNIRVESSSVVSVLSERVFPSNQNMVTASAPITPISQVDLSSVVNDHHTGPSAATTASVRNNGNTRNSIGDIHEHEREISTDNVAVPLFSDKNRSAKHLYEKQQNTRSKSATKQASVPNVETVNNSNSSTSGSVSGGAKVSRRKREKPSTTDVSTTASNNQATNNPTASAPDDAFLNSLHQSLVNADNGNDPMYGNTNALLNSSTIKTATNASSMGPIPKQLKATFTNDYNLLDANQTILRKFEMLRQQERPRNQRRLAELETRLNTGSMRIVERKSMERECEALRDSIDACSEELEKTYQVEVRQILERYHQLGPRVRIIRFGRNTKDITPAGQDKERAELIETFIEVARKYIDVQLTRVLPNDRNCTNCNLSGNELVVDDEGVSCCPRCGLERLFAYNCPVPIEELPSSRSEYEDRKNLYKALMRYQGKQPNKLPNSLENDLDEYFRSFGLPTGNQVRACPLNAKGSRGNTSLQLMFRALSETGHAEHYENCNLICAQYWGWSLPDVSQLEDIIMADYDATQAVYERMVRKRKSSINTQFRLFKHLQARGHQCSLTDFKVVTTPDILAALEEMWREMVEGANVEGLRYIPTL